MKTRVMSVWGRRMGTIVKIHDPTPVRFVDDIEIDSMDTLYDVRWDDGTISKCVSGKALLRVKE